MGNPVKGPAGVGREARPEPKLRLTKPAHCHKGSAGLAPSPEGVSPARPSQFWAPSGTLPGGGETPMKTYEHL